MGRRNLSSWSGIERVAGLRGDRRHHRTSDCGGAVLADFGQAQPNSPLHHHLGQLPQVCGGKKN